MTAWKNILERSRVAKTETKPFTHTGYTGGKYNLPMTEEDWKIYEETCSKTQQHLIERPLEDCSPVIALDLDFRYDASVITRQHDHETVTALVTQIAKTVAELCGDTVPSVYNIGVEEKNITTLKKTDDGKQRKDGLHIKLGIRANRAIQKVLRDKLMMAIPQHLEKLPLINAIGDIIDPAVLGGVNGLTMPLSSKPDDKPYELTHLFRAEKEGVFRVCDDEPVPPMLLSIRNRELPEVAWSACAEWVTMEQVNKKIRKSPLVASEAVSDPSAEVIAEIEKRTKPEDARGYETWWKTSVKILKWCDARGGDEGRNAVHYFSKRCPEKYDARKVDGWIHGCDFQKYDKLVWREPKKTDMSFLTVLLKGASAVCDVIVEDLRPNWVFDGVAWWCCDAETKLWKNAPIYSAIVRAIHTRIDDLLECVPSDEDDEEKAKQNKKTRAILFKQYKETDNPTYLKGATNHLETVLKDADFVGRCNALFGYLAFKNGVVDMKTGEFREGIRQGDYLTKTIPMDYDEPEAEHLEKVAGIIWDICSHNKEQEAYLYRQLGYCMTGFADKEQAFFFWEGLTASNGKSTIMEALARTPYVTKLHNETFKTDNAKYHKHIYEVKQNARIAWLNEPAKSKGAKLDETKLKEFADGTEIKNEVMFGTIETINNHAKLIFTDNSPPCPANADKGYERRLYMSKFDAKFYNQQDWKALTESGEEYNRDTNFLADNSIIGYMKSDEALLSLLHLIMKGYRDYLKQGLNQPKQFQAVKEEAVSSGDPVGEYCRHRFRKCIGQNIGKEWLRKHYNKDTYGNADDTRDNSRTLVACLKRLSYDYESQKSYRVNGRVMSGMIMNIEYVPLECNDGEGDDYFVD